MEELIAAKETIKITPVNPKNNLANPAATSPFDKPNVDPLANQFPPESGKAPEPTNMVFPTLVHNFGRINEGDVVRTVFKFTNTGKNPLIIRNAQGSCGCTVPRWPQHPVKSGANDEIGVEFNSEGKRGEVEKTVTVSANTNPPQTTLIIKATIIPKDK